MSFPRRVRPATLQANETGHPEGARSRATTRAWTPWRDSAGLGAPRGPTRWLEGGDWGQGRSLSVSAEAAANRNWVGRKWQKTDGWMDLHWVTDFEFATLVHLHFVQVLYWWWMKEKRQHFILSVNSDLISSNKITRDTQPLTRVGFILMTPDVSWWPSAKTLQNFLKWINTLKIHMFFHFESRIDAEFCHF